MRVWEQVAETLLTGPLGLVPLAPVANVSVADVPAILRRVEDRVTSETDPTTGGQLLTAVGIRLQLRYGVVSTEEFIRRFPEIREFGAFRSFLAEGRAEGRVEGLRQAILRQGRKKFDQPTPAQEAAVVAITDLARLEALSEKLLDVNSWDELLQDT